MTMINRGAAALTIVVALTLGAGCSGNTALIGKDTFPARPSQPVQNEMVATVERLEATSREIHFRPNSGRREMITYSGETG
jgi:hypothetical protein